MNIKSSTARSFINCASAVGVFMALLVSSFSSGAQNNYNSKRIAGDSLFAEYLISNNLYSDAISFCHHKASNAKDIRESNLHYSCLGRIYFINENYDSAWKYLSQITIRASEQDVMMLYGSELFVKKNIDNCSGVGNLNRTIMQLSYYLITRNTSKFDSVISVADKFYLDNIFIDNLRKIRADINNKHKSALFAALLSTIIPGAGKLYIGNPSQGLSALFLELLIGGQVLEIWSHGMWSNPLFYPYATMLLLFHTGNIYGSYIDTKIKEASHDEQINIRVFSTIHSYILSLQ